MTLSNWDKTVRLGVWPFSVTLEKTNPFYYLVADHDNGYDLIAQGVATFTLKELDRNFLKNGLFTAMRYELWIDRVWVARQVWLAYRACRTWAKYVRPELERWRPGMPAPTLIQAQQVAPSQRAYRRMRAESQAQQQRYELSRAKRLRVADSRIDTVDRAKEQKP